jgi:hypothetical protein
MKKLKLSHINQSFFEQSFQRFKKNLQSDFEYSVENQELTTNSFDFDKWHLVTLAISYGSNVFINSSEIRIDEHQICGIKFNKKYDTPIVNLTTNWNEKVEVNPALLFFADAFLTQKLTNLLSDQSKNFLKQKMPSFNFEQTVYGLNAKRFAYLIVSNTLVFIQDNENTGEITDLFKISWYEI